MIFSELNRLSRYRGLSKHFDTAIDFLNEVDLSALPMGQTVIDGKNVFVNRFDYDTAPEPLTEWHDRYIDIHVVIEGEEQIGVVNTATLEVTDPENEDHTCMVSDFMNTSVLKPGYALITFPEDAHSPKRQNGGSCHIKKAVIKVLDE